ncbi:MAG TPA: chromosome segregation protein SMC [Pyrinomonadaceae bacterium]|nr:chromosome segregation protein SMC [Pyrinomonadaceae bacterium]
MFKLERLEITGFKSFADYTEILFTGDGITAIVGPNGCGKSNVADAIAWVLGEQRVKHLRGGEMKDVIFQGARNRAPSGMAEVVMHMIRDEVDEVEPDIEDIDSTLERIDDRLVNLDEILPQEQVEASADAAPQTEPSAVAPGNDTNGASEPDSSAVVAAPTQKITYKRHWRRRNLALEFAPGEAVSVTRRLYRSGESEYLLNGKICRLRDIQDLFSGTGLAGGHYAIIEQGRIGQILSAKPMDRRTIIEEAAGITKFRVRQRATEARLESARSNLSRISDIVAEIDRQVNSLRRQAAKARRYGVLREELRELLRHVYVAEDQKLATVLEETNSKLSEITELEVGIAGDLNKREEAARAATHEARSLEDELSTARAAAAEAVLRRDRQARECVYQKEQLSEIEKRKGEVTAEIEALTSRLVLIEAECRRLQQEDARLREEFDQSALVLRTAEESYAEKLSASNAAEIEIESSRAELLSQTAIAERVREIARQLETTLERLSQQAESLAREGDRAASQHAERKVEAERYARELGDARARVAKLQAEREMAVDAVVRGHEAVSDTEAELTRVRDEHSRASHRLESLKELDQRRAYYSPAVQLIFSPTETPRDFHFIGTLADALNVDAKWERAVEGVLGSSLQSIVVPTPDDAVRAAQWLRENNGGRASFLVAGLHGGSEEVEEVDTLPALTCRLEERPLLLLTSGSTEPVREDLRISDLLGAPQQLVTVLKRTLPQKMDARIAANLEDAMVKSIATGEMYVTLNGDWIASGQFVNAGDARDLEEGAGLLAFKRELRELETRAEALAREVDTVASSAKDARARMVELEDAVVLLNEQIGREEREAMAHEHTATNLAQEVERAERHMRVVGQDSARVDEERLEIENRRAQALLEAEAAETAREAAADKVIKASSLLTDLRREAETESDSLAQQRAAAAAASERRRATTAELRRIEGELADFAARVDRHRMELAEMGGRSDELTLSIADLELAASTVESDRAREEEQIADLSNRLQEARRQADEFSAELSELNRRAAEVRDSRGGLEVQRAEAQARQTFVHENCQTELGQSLEELARELTFPEEFDLEASHTRVEELRTRLEGFGGVNMMALEELAEAEQRLLFLTVQRQDIIEGISATEEALREIKRRSRERFRHAFEQINKNFSSLFQELFGGGRGEMSLIDADDVLESGIDVVAQPPGKRLQNVLLLSGGEKAMAALALVLGIFHYRPAPFCLLDEVDAPLDEANVGRFTDKVVQMSANTQFIVITHNKRTMEMARALYGVTMEEAGVSKLVSVKFE